MPDQMLGTLLIQFDVKFYGSVGVEKFKTSKRAL